MVTFSCGWVCCSTTDLTLHFLFVRYSCLIGVRFVEQDHNAIGGGERLDAVVPKTCVVCQKTDVPSTYKIKITTTHASVPVTPVARGETLKLEDQ